MIGRLPALLLRVSRSRLARNVGSLYGVQFADYLLPLIVIPYLARVLGPAPWGRLVFFQAFATWLSLVLEFGFGFSATRQIAQERADPELVAKIVSSVLGATGLLLGVLVIVALLLFLFLPAVSAYPSLFMLACASAIFQGLRPFWYFQGVEKMTITAALNLGGRLLYTALVFVVIRHAEDMSWVLSLQVAISGLVLAGAFVMLYRDVRFVRPGLRESLGALKSGWHMFVFRSTISLYTTANTFILGLLASPADVSYFGGAERIARAGVGLIGPVSQSLFPKLSYLHKSDPAQAHRLARMGFIYMTCTGVLMSAGMAIFSRPAISLLLGPKYLPAIPVLRILCLLPIAVAVSNSLATGWLMPMGRDSAVTWVIAAGAAVNLAMAPTMVRNFGVNGMATTVVVAESVIAVGTVIALVMMKKGKGTIDGSQPQSVESL